MKRISFLLLLAVSLLLSGCAGSFQSSGYYNEVRFTKGIIHTIDRYTVTLSDGSIWKTRRLITAVNMSPVMLVVRESLDEGFLYVDGFKYRLILSMTNFDRVSYYSFGYLDLLQSLEKEKSVIGLFQGTKFYVRPEDIPKIESWGAGPEVILNSGRNYLINPKSMEGIPVIEIPPLSNEKIQ